MFLKNLLFKGFAYGRFSLQSTILKWLPDSLGLFSPAFVNVQCVPRY